MIQSCIEMGFCKVPPPPPSGAFFLADPPPPSDPPQVVKMQGFGGFHAFMGFVGMACKNLLRSGTLSRELRRSPNRVEVNDLAGF